MTKEIDHTGFFRYRLHDNMKGTMKFPAICTSWGDWNFRDLRYPLATEMSPEGTFLRYINKSDYRTEWVGPS